jgi:uncharacterized membrane protein
MNIVACEIETFSRSYECGDFIERVMHEFVEAHMQQILEHPTARERHFREMAVWHEWPIEACAPRRVSVRSNVGPAERWVNTIGGGTLAAYGLAKRSTAGWAMAALGAALLARGVTGYCPAYRQLRINNARHGQAEPIDFYEYGIQVSKAVTINTSPQTLFNFWRDFTNLPKVMSHLESVVVLDDKRSHWIVKGPMNSRIEWDAEIINEEPYELIAWRSLPGAEIDNAGSVRFIRSPGARGTQVRVNIEYIPVAGKLGAVIAKMFGEEPNQQVREDLRRFKQIMETGESPSTAGQPVGQCGGRGPRERGRIRSLTPRRGFTGKPNGSPVPWPFPRPSRRNEPTDYPIGIEWSPS